MERIRSVEMALNGPFPADYKEFVATFGAGSFANIDLEVPGPESIEAELEKIRKSFDEDWFYDDSPEVMTQA
ncbi:MAG: SMI1/KNR4 family protein, partial [Verrucomicrobiota bacterium]